MVQQEEITEGSHCEVCGEVIVAQKDIKALGHIKVVKKVKKATYKAQGYSGDTYCKTCNTLLSKGKATAKLKAKNQTISLKKASATYKASALKKKGASFAIGAKAKGSLSYKIVTKKVKGIKVSKTGKVTISKGCKKQTVKITVTAKASKDGQYKQASKTVTVKIK